MSAAFSISNHHCMPVSANDNFVLPACSKARCEHSVIPLYPKSGPKKALPEPFLHGPSFGARCARVHNNHLGSAQSGTTASGSVAWRERYSPFGSELVGNATNDNQSGFTGHIKDSATGLNYMQARYYDPVIGRFLSVDPVTFSMTGDPGYFNRYAYTANDPINMIDPDGRQVVQDGVLKVTVSAGASWKSGIGSQGSGALALGLGLDVLTEYGIGLPSDDRGVPVNIFGIPSGVITLDAIGVAGNFTDADTFQGVQADTDVGEIGFSLGDIDDREGSSDTLEGDFENVGVEFSTSGEVAGSTIKVDFFGPGLGGSLSESNTIVAEEHRFDK